MRGAKPVEEMQEGDASLQRGGMTYCRQIMGLLHRSRAQKSEAYLPACHHVGVISENRERVGGQRPGCYVHAKRRQLTGNLVEVWDHQQQTLRCSEGGG